MGKASKRHRSKCGLSNQLDSSIDIDPLAVLNKSTTRLREFQEEMVRAQQIEHERHVSSRETRISTISNQGNTMACAAISALISVASLICNSSLSDHDLSSMIKVGGQILVSAVRYQGQIPESIGERRIVNADGRVPRREGTYIVSNECE